MRLLLLVVLTCTGAYAQTLQVDKIDVSDCGIYTAKVVGSVEAPNTALGTSQILNNISLAETTRTIPAQIGVHFGFQYTLVGAPNGAVVALHMVTIFPSPGLLNPAKQIPKMKDEYDHTVAIGKNNFHDYSFDNNWELVPGTWTFQIWYQGRKLAEQSFNVVRQ